MSQIEMRKSTQADGRFRLSVDIGPEMDREIHNVHEIVCVNTGFPIQKSQVIKHALNIGLAQLKTQMETTEEAT